MAAALVGGAFLSSFLNVVFERLAKQEQEVVNWIKGKKLDKKLLDKLKPSLNAVQAVLNDAEQKQITNPAVKNWLVDLEDAVYKADDLLDEVYTKAATQKDPGNSLSQSLNLEDKEMVTKIEQLIDTLELLVKHKAEYDLKEVVGENMSWRDPSTSLVESSGIYGRDKDKEAIIELLLNDTYDDVVPAMVSVVGIGGIGKTTLAQLVYNDDKLKEKFNFKAWVCVSDQFDVRSVTKTIIEAMTSCSCNMNDLNLLQTKLKEVLTGTTFFIVLDDVWSERSDKWDTLLKPFHFGNKGSKILLTTRSEKVASMMPPISPYKLSLLSDEDCWSVFLKRSFLSAECREYATLEPIGRKIVKKCSGLPLAVETLGSLLRGKSDARDWDDILKSEIWELSEDDSRIMPALRISYHYLPSHLKRCFVYCSLYPKDYRFVKDELILLWMAEGFLQRTGKKPLEEIGCGYFNELVARSFFQLVSSDDSSYFVMHDLMHDLATFYGGKFYFRAEELENAYEIDIKTRHFSHIAGSDYPISKLLAACDGVNDIRTFLRFSFESLKIEEALFISLLRWRCLRALSLTRFSIDCLPDSIGKLIHLRYLDLSGTSITTLPESLSNLYNLQTLKLKYCRELEVLPSNMQDLVNLRHLDIRDTPLKEMPKGMNKLKHLQFLSDFIVGKHKENGAGELGALVHLHGSLSIQRLENVISSGEASKERLLDKNHINALDLQWSSNDGIASSQIERDIMDKFQPPGDLEDLTISGYRGTVFPNWLGHSSYHKMASLTLTSCSNCCMLPSLGQLPFLKELYISDFDGLEKIGAELYKNDESCRDTPFSSLETLTFDNMRCWKEWVSFQFGAFPQLKHLEVYNCPVLEGGLPNHLPALRNLDIRYCKQLVCSLPKAPALLELYIVGVNEVKVQQLTCLETLIIRNCSSCGSFPGACVPATLQELFISDCEKLELQMQQPNEKLRKLDLSNIGDSITSFPLNAFPNLSSLTIRDCENMKCLPISRDPPATLQSAVDGENEERMQQPPLLLHPVKEVSISGTQQVEYMLDAMTYTQFNCLQSLYISGCSSDVSFPGDSQFNCLRSLYITDCSSYVSFPGDSQFNCLQSLYIKDCSSDVSFPGDCLPASLESLSILNCKKMVFPMQQQQWPNSLKSISIYNSCDSLASFPLVAFPNLTELNICGCENMKCLEVSQQSQSEDVALLSLRELSIDECPSFVSFSTLGLSQSLRKVYITNCEKLISWLASMDLHSHGLTRLVIGGPCESVKSFPKEKEGCLPASLEILQLWEFPSLEALDCNGLLHLTSLRELSIVDCPKLQHVMGERLPPSLKRLFIRITPLLGEQCKTKDPQIWPKISHINSIHVDYKQIS